MKHLSARELYQLAPAARPRKNANAERLLDTAAWIREAGDQGYLPVFAMQGSSHKDAKRDAADGRHLVVCVKENGEAVALLNSHDRLMRIYAGAGWFINGELLLAQSFPRKRVGGFDIYRLGQFVPPYLLQASSGRKQYKIIEEICSNGYIQGRGLPDPNDVVERLGGHEIVGDAYLAACVVAELRKGNLRQLQGERRIKGIRRPDTYWHLAQAAWKAVAK